MRAHALIALCSALVGGCAAIGLPPMDDRDRSYGRMQAVREHAALDMFLERRTRLHLLAWNMGVANVESCRRWRPAAGAMALGPEAVPAALRAVSETRFGEGVWVGAVAPFSPADGLLRAGDRVILANGLPVVSVGGFRELVAAGGGVLRLDVDRGGRSVSVVLRTAPVCGYPVELVEAPERTAWSDGEAIWITSGMMESAGADDELAAVLGHEMAHAVLGHSNRRSAGEELERLEEMADYYGVLFAGRAGYAVEVAPRFWSKLNASYGYHRRPASVGRRLAMEAAIRKFREERRSARAAYTRLSRSPMNFGKLMAIAPAIPKVRPRPNRLSAVVDP